MDNEKSKVANYLKALDGISYFQWIKLRSIVECHFEEKDHEFKRGLKLTAEEADDATRERFG